MEERKTIQAYVSAQTKETVDRIRDQLGMTQVEVFSRIINWFSSQDETIQRSILGILPEELLPDIAAAWMRRHLQKQKKRG